VESVVKAAVVKSTGRHACESTGREACATANHAWPTNGCSAEASACTNGGWTETTAANCGWTKAPAHRGRTKAATTTDRGPTEAAASADRGSTEAAASTDRGSTEATAASANRGATAATKAAATAEATTTTAAVHTTSAATKPALRRGDIRCKHCNGGCREQGDHHFAQHDQPPPHPIAPERNDAFGAIALQSGEGFSLGSRRFRSNLSDGD
jgi:hypothetical protein